MMVTILTLMITSTMHQHLIMDTRMKSWMDQVATGDGRCQSYMVETGLKELLQLELEGRSLSLSLSLDQVE